MDGDNGRWDRVLGYRPKKPREGNGEAAVFYDIHLLASTIHGWGDDEESRKALRQQGYDLNRIFVKDGRIYPITLLERLESYHDRHPDCFE